MSTSNKLYSGEIILMLVPLLLVLLFFGLQSCVHACFPEHRVLCGLEGIVDYQPPNISVPEKLYYDDRFLHPTTENVKCGACYIIAAMELAGYYFSQAAGNKVEFSAAEVLDCIYLPGVDDKKKCQNGGSPSDVLGYATNPGLCLKENYHDWVDEALKCDKRQQKHCSPRNKIENHGRMQVPNALRLKQTLVDKAGPLIVAIDYSDELDKTKGRIPFNGICSSSMLKANHAVLLLGYDQLPNPTTGLMEEVWIIFNNHHGTGDDQKFYLSMATEPNKCGLFWNIYYLTMK